MLRKFRVGALCLLLAASSACSGTSTIAPSATPDRTAEAKDSSLAATRLQNEARATAGQVTKEAEQLAATNQAATEVHLTMEAVAREATWEAAIVEALAEETAQAQPLFDLVQELHSEGYLIRTGGTYYAIEDFDESWAQINWYSWWHTGYSPTNFVIRADASWDSASNKANWWNSGCGFVFREKDEYNFYAVQLALDGWVHLWRVVEDVEAPLGESYYGRVEVPSGEAEIMLVVEDTRITVFVNGDKVHSRQDSALPSGDLSLTLFSGINTGFGTRCRMTNIELWMLD